MYFIYDCNDKIVGNPKGYRTFAGAERQQNYNRSPAYAAIWDAFYKKYPLDDKLTCLVSKIKLIEGV